MTTPHQDHHLERTMAAAIRQLLPEAEIRLFGSRARGEANPASDIDLLITAPDQALAGKDRFSLLNQLWGAVARPEVSVDLLLHSRSEAARRADQAGSVVHQALSEGILLHDPS
jgi:predicted nucleotidyltransferase